MPRPSRLRYLGIAALVAVALFAGAGKLGNFLPALPNPFSPRPSTAPSRRCCSPSPT